MDGTDLSACLEVLGAAVAQARRGEGPQLVVASLLRLCGHGEHDDAGYIDPRLKNSPLGRDCLKVAEDILVSRQWADPEDLAIWRNEALRTIETTVARVQREPAPDPFTESWTAISADELRETHDELGV